MLCMCVACVCVCVCVCSVWLRIAQLLKPMFLEFSGIIDYDYSGFDQM